MTKLFEISSEERNRILEMHVSATKKNYLSEQTSQKIQPPKPDILKQIEGNFNINDVLSKWNTQTQGISGDYYWIASVSGEAYGASYVELKKLIWYGGLRHYYTLKYMPQQKQWELIKQDVSTNPAAQIGWNEILKQLVIYNPKEDYVMGGSSQTKYKLNNALYNEYVASYVNRHPDSNPAKAFKVPKEKIVADRNVTAAQIGEIKKSPLYVRLNASSTPTTTAG